MMDDERFKVVREPAQVLLGPDRTMFEVRRVRLNDPADPKQGEVIADDLGFEAALAEKAKLGEQYDALIALLLAYEAGGLSHFRVLPCPVSQPGQ